jgi:formate-dependent nitrite reductase cytochrome c552 subunit
MTDKNHGWHRTKRAELIEARGGACEECGSANQLEFAHTKPTGLVGMGRGFNERVLDVLQHPKSYRLLCRNCHMRLDAAA